MFPVTTSDPKGWYSRDYLPHFDRPNLIQGITFRLQDSMPQVLLARWNHELQSLNPDQQAIERQKRIATFLDSGHGSCYLRTPEIAAMAQVSALRNPSSGVR